MQGHLGNGGRARSTSSSAGERGLAEIVLADVPAVMGIWMSNTIIFAVNDDTKGTICPGRQSTLPMLSEMGSTPVSVRFTLEPAPAHGRLSPSLSIAMEGVDQLASQGKRANWPTFHSSGFVAGDNPQAFTSNNDSTAYAS